MLDSPKEASPFPVRLKPGMTRNMCNLKADLKGMCIELLSPASHPEPKAYLVLLCAVDQRGSYFVRLVLSTNIGSCSASGEQKQLGGQDLSKAICLVPFCIHNFSR